MMSASAGACYRHGSSVALLGLVIDSFVESASGGILISRLQSEGLGCGDEKEIRALDERAHRLALTLFALGG